MYYVTKGSFLIILKGSHRRPKREGRKETGVYYHIPLSDHTPSDTYRDVSDGVWSVSSALSTQTQDLWDFILTDYLRVTFIPHT